MTDHHVDPEVAALRAEVARLRAQVAGDRSETAAADTRPLDKDDARSGRWRPAAATVLIVVMAVVAPLAVVARWAHDMTADTDRYVAAIAPLANDPDVQAAVVDRITTEITTRLQVESVTDQAIDALTDRGLGRMGETSLRALAGPLTEAVEGLVEDQVTVLVESDQFEQAWIATNREAHTQLVAVLTGADSDVVQVGQGTVSVNLATVIEAVKQRLIDRGFTLAERLPAIDAEFTIVQSADLTKAQTGFRLLSALSTWLPILALLCLIGAVAVARSWRRTLVVGTLTLALSMVLLGLGLDVFRELYLNAVPPEQLPTPAAAAIYDDLAGFIRLSLRAVLVLALAVAAITWVSGPERAPTALRRGTARAVGVARSGGERVGLDTGRFGEALTTYRTPIRVTVLAAALLLYVLRDHPTPAFAVTLLVAAGVILLLVELLARPLREQPVETGTG